MSYAPKRPKVTPADRAFILARDKGCCYLCGLPIAEGEEWDADHEFARELGGSDGIENLRPAHKSCHRKKSKLDIKLIAKSRRIVRANGPKELRRRKQPIRTRASPWPPKGARKFNRRNP